MRSCRISLSRFPRWPLLIRASLGSLLAAATLTPVAAQQYHRAALQQRVVSLSPPALSRAGHLFVPLSFVEHALGMTANRDEDEQAWVLCFFDRRVVFNVGVAEARGAHGTQTLPAAPFIEGGELYLPAELLRTMMGVDLAVGQQALGVTAVEVAACGAQVEGIRLGQHPDKVRLVVDLDGETVFSWRQWGDRVEIHIPPPIGSTPRGPEISMEGFSSQYLGTVTRSVTDEGFTLIEASVNSTQPPEIFTLSDPARIVIDVPVAPVGSPEVPPSTLAPTTPVGRGNPPTWTRRHFSTPRGVVHVYVLKISPSDPNWVVRPALAGSTIHTRRSVLSIAQREGAVAAINGGFFAAQGPPAGLVVIDGQWICAPQLNRTILGLSATGEARLGRWRFAGKVFFPGHGYLEISGLNRKHHSGNELILYTRHWGRELSGNTLYTRLRVNEAGVIVLQEKQGRPVEIPEQGYILSGRGRTAESLNELALGETARLVTGLEPPWEELWSALEGGPRLLTDGEIRISNREERFREYISSSIAPRSAVGLTQDGELLLVGVESPGVGRGGVSLLELATIMRKLGAYQAMNLDGGGSTTVVQAGRIINRVSSSPRAVSNALVVVPRPHPVPTAAPVGEAEGQPVPGITPDQPAGD